jgi:hypothetical protein
MSVDTSAATRFTVQRKTIANAMASSAEAKRTDKNEKFQSVAKWQRSC